MHGVRAHGLSELLGVWELKEFIVEAKILVLKRTKSKPHWMGRIGPRAQGFHSSKCHSWSEWLGGTWCCKTTQSPRLKHLFLCLSPRAPTAIKEKKWLSYPCHVLKLTFINPMIFSFSLNTCCKIPSVCQALFQAIWTCCSLLLECVFSDNSMHSSSSLSSFKSFIQISCSQWGLSWPGFWKLHLFAPQPFHSLFPTLYSILHTTFEYGVRFTCSCCLFSLRRREIA